MHHTNFQRMKIVLVTLTLLSLLALFLVGCARGQNGIFGTNNQNSSTTNAQSSSTDDETSVKSGNQQIQNLLRSLDKAQKDAVDAGNSGDQQDTYQMP